jgi:CheY-like chemotaxis protein
MILSLYFIMVGDEKKELLDKAEEYKGYLIGSLERPLWTIDGNTIASIGKTFSQNELVVRMVIRDYKNDTIFKMEKNHNSDLVSSSSKIYHKGNYLGEFEFSLTKTKIEATGRKLLFAHVATMILILLSLFVVTGILIRRLLKNPLNDLDASVRSYAEGNYDTDPSDLPYLEFRPFGKVLSQMGQAIKKHQIHLEEMDGLEATRQIKETDAGKSTIVAALTAHALEEEKEDVLAAGCDNFVRKPFREHEIFEVIGKHLGVKYVYEDILPADETSMDTPVQMPLIAESLPKVPEAMLMDLLHAAEETNPANTQAVIDQIAEQNQPLASELAKLAADFRFDVLRDLIEANK